MSRSRFFRNLFGLSEPQLDLIFFADALSPGHKEQTRQKIIDAASKVFRNQGFTGGGVDSVMAEAGLTAGGFYSHFKNKEDLLVQMLEISPDQFRDRLPPEILKLEGTARIEALIDNYLSPEHCLANSDCCPLPSLVSEIERQGPECREAFATVMEGWSRVIAESLVEVPKKDRKKRAQALFSFVVGTAAMARALQGTSQFDSTLANGRGAAKRLLRG